MFEVKAQTSPSCTILLAGQVHCWRTIQSEEDAQELLVYAEELSVCSGVGKTSEFKPLDTSDCTTSSGHGLYATVCDGSISRGMFFGTCLSSVRSVKTYFRYLMTHPLMVCSTGVSTTLTGTPQRCLTRRKGRRIVIAHLLCLKNKAQCPLVQTAVRRLKRAVCT